MSEECFDGPDDFAELVLAERNKSEMERSYFGDISEDGVRRLICIAYYASQAPNEGRFPRLTFVVPAMGEEVNLVIPLNEELNVGFLGRIAPALASENHAVFVQERNNALQVTGIAPIKGVLSEMAWGDPTSGTVLALRCN
jgi:hypothetical protein